MKNSKERILFICNTYMQLITAIQIKRKLFEDNNADLILSDRSVNVVEVAEQLRKTQIFNEIKVSKVKYYFEEKESLIQKVLDIVRLSFGIGSAYKNMFLMRNMNYDRIFYYNYDILSLLPVIDFFKKKQDEKIVFCRLEEGLATYHNMVKTEFSLQKGKVLFISKLRKLFHKPLLSEITNEYYVFFPNLFPHAKATLHEIPKLDRHDKDLITILNTCFAYDPQYDSYPEKYIFFGSAREVDGQPTDETKLILKFADLVGKENLLIKMHPRDGRKIYEEYGITVSKKSSIPWEVIQLSHDFSSHIFITVSSGSVICSCALLEDPVPTYLIYPMDRGKDVSYDSFCDTALGRLIEKLNEQNLCSEHIVTDSFSAIIAIDKGKAGDGKR